MLHIKFGKRCQFRLGSINSSVIVNQKKAASFNCFINLESFRLPQRIQKCWRILYNSMLRPRPLYKKVVIKTYMKPNQMSFRFSTRRDSGGYSAVDQSNIVYSFNCSEEGSNASFYGYTTNKLSIRINQNRYSQSSIYKHFTIDHDENVLILSKYVRRLLIYWSKFVK